MAKLRIELQNEISECGLACIAMIASHHGAHGIMARLRRTVQVSKDGMSVYQIGIVAEQLGLVTRAFELGIEHLPELKLPCILFWDQRHFVVLESFSAGKAVICDPALGRVEYSAKELANHFSAIAVELMPGFAFKSQSHEADAPPPRERHPFLFREILRQNPDLYRYIIPMVLIGLLLHVFSIIGPKLFSLAIDEVVAKDDADFLLLLVYIFGFIYLIQAVFEALKVRLEVMLQGALSYDLAIKLFDWLLRLHLPFIEKRPVADIQRKLLAVQRAHIAFTHGWIEFWIGAAFAIIFLTLMLFTNVKLAVVVTLIFTVFIVLKVLSIPYLEMKQLKIIAAETDRESISMKTFADFEQVKMFNLAAQSSFKWQNSHSLAVKATTALQGMMSYMTVVHTLALNAMTIATVYFGTHAVLAGANTLGELIAFVMYKDSFAALLVGLIDKLVTIRINNVEIKRATDLTQAETDHGAEGDEGLARRIERIDIIDGEYRPGSLDDAIFAHQTLAIARGDKTAITGKSGSGKSTLLKVILGLYPLSAGAFRINGLNIKQYGWANLRARIGHVPSKPSILDASVVENIVFESSQHELSAVIAVLERVGLREDIDKLPANLFTRLGAGGVELSAGQAQRLMLARALFKAPEILVLDEPTSHLDSASKAHIIHVIRTFDGTVVFATHDPDLITAADHVIHLERHVPAGA
jgi:ATP-binding cassette subfamily B protein RaxB